MKIKKMLVGVLSVCILLGTLIGLNELLKPKYMTSVFEGNLTGDYYRSEKDHDVIILGDCEVYENISPIAMWEEYGLKTYVRGNAQQLVWQSYYLLEDTLKYETPDVVVFNVLAMRYGEPKSEAYNRMTLDAMPLSSTKIDAVKVSMTEEETLSDYIFPLFRYHTRWSELTDEDFEYVFKEKKKTSHNGYLMNVGVKPVGVIPNAKPLPNYQFPKTAYEYLDKIRELCESKGIQLVLMKAPTIYPVWYEQWDAQMVDYAVKHDLLYVNFLNQIDEVGIDFNVDTYDAGLHMNAFGSQKVGSYLGKVLTENFDLEDHRGDEKDLAIWNEKVKFFYEMMADQQYELETYGYLKSYGGTKPEEEN